MYLLKKLSVLFGTAAIIISCASNADEAELNNSIPVRIAIIERIDASIPVTSAGILSAEGEFRLSFKTGGLIDKILVDKGSKVIKGDLLARLNLSEIQAQRNQASSGFEKAKRDYERMKNLYQDSVVTREQLQNIETALEVAQSNLNIAEFNLKYSSIIAPEDGKILKRFSEENEIVGPGTPIFIFGSGGNQWLFKTGVSDRDVLKIGFGDQATITFDAYPDETFSATVTEIAAASNPMTGLYELELLMSDKGKKLLSGFIGKVSISPANKSQMAVIPAEALTEGNGTQGFVFVPNPDSVSVDKIEIEIAQISADGIRVSNLNSDHTDVITSGSAYLSENSEIVIIRE